MIRIAKCLSDEYIHSLRLKNFCLEHKMTEVMMRRETREELEKELTEKTGVNSVVLDRGFSKVLGSDKNGKRICKSFLRGNGMEKVPEGIYQSKTYD